MLVNVKMLIGILIVLFISACSNKEVVPSIEYNYIPEYIYIPQKCIIPDIEKPVVDNSKKENIFDSAKQCTLNYILLKEYLEKLESNIEVCK